MGGHALWGCASRVGKKIAPTLDVCQTRSGTTVYGRFVQVVGPGHHMTVRGGIFASSGDWRRENARATESQFTVRTSPQSSESVEVERQRGFAVLHMLRAVQRARLSGMPTSNDQCCIL